MNLKQFKLTNGDEILCEFVEEDEQTGLVLVRKILKIISTDDFESNVRYYSFKPWVSFQDDFDEIVILNSDHVVGQTLPSKSLVTHFAIACKEVLQSAKDKKNLNLDEILAATDDMSSDELLEYMTEKLASMDEESADDSALANVIKFRPKDTTFH